MSPWYFLSVTVHLLAALLWLGGMLFLAVVGAPVLRRLEPAELRRDLWDSLGTRFRTVGWLSIAVLIVTGAANLGFRGLLHWSLLSDPGFWNTGFGRALGWKLAMAAVMLAASAAHDFVLGPAAGRVAAGSEEARRLNRRATLLARLNALAGIVLVAAAARLARGG